MLKQYLKLLWQYILKKKGKSADGFNIVLNVLRTVNAKVSGGKWVTGGIRNSSFLCSELCIEPPASLSGSDCAGHGFSKLCVLQGCQVYGFYLDPYGQRMGDRGSFPGKQFFCGVVGGTVWYFA